MKGGDEHTGVRQTGGGVARGGGHRAHGLRTRIGKPKVRSGGLRAAGVAGNGGRGQWPRAEEKGGGEGAPQRRRRGMEVGEKVEEGWEHAVTWRVW